MHKTMEHIAPWQRPEIQAFTVGLNWYSDGGVSIANVSDYLPDYLNALTFVLAGSRPFFREGINSVPV